MQRFAVKICILSALVLMTLAALFHSSLPYSHDLSMILDKRDLLAKKSDRDRIIIIGGSGAFFGLNSERIQSQCDRLVVNMGLYAGFGIDSLLISVQPFIRQNDIIIVMPEYSIINDQHDDHARKWIMALSPYRNIPLLYERSFQGAARLLQDASGLLDEKVANIPRVVKALIRKKAVYSSFNNGFIDYRARCNANGDSLILLPAGTEETIKEKGGLSLAYQNQSIDALNEFSRIAGEKGAHTYYMFSVYPYSEYDRSKEVIGRYYERLNKQHYFSVLGKPEDFAYPYKLFANTVHHLNEEGREIRTQKVISLLRSNNILHDH